MIGSKEGARPPTWPRIVSVLAGPALVSLIVTALVPAMPGIARAYGAGADGALLAQIVMTLPAVVLIFSAPLAGLLSARLGLRKLILVSLGVYLLGGMVGLLASNVPLLALSRLLLGLAGGGLQAGCLALVGEFEDHARERTLGFAVAASSAAAILGLMGAGSLVDHLGWHAAFGLYLLALLPVPAVLLGVHPEAGFGAHHRLSLAPLVRIAGPLALAVTLCVGMFTVVVQMPFRLNDLGVTSATVQSLVISAFSFVALISSAVFGPTYDRLGPRGMVLTTAGCFGVGLAAAGIFRSVIPIALASALAGVGAGFVEATCGALVLRRVPPEARPAAMGALVSAIFAGQFLNPFLLDPLRRSFGVAGSFRATGLFFLAFAAVAAVSQVAARSRGRRKRAAKLQSRSCEPATTP